MVFGLGSLGEGGECTGWLMMQRSLVISRSPAAIMSERL